MTDQGTEGTRGTDAVPRTSVELVEGCRVVASFVAHVVRAPAPGDDLVLVELHEAHDSVQLWAEVIAVEPSLELGEVLEIGTSDGVRRLRVVDVQIGQHFEGVVEDGHGNRDGNQVERRAWLFADVADAVELGREYRALDAEREAARVAREAVAARVGEVVWLSLPDGTVPRFEVLAGPFPASSAGAVVPSSWWYGGTPGEAWFSRAGLVYRARLLP